MVIRGGRVVGHCGRDRGHVRPRTGRRFGLAHHRMPVFGCPRIHGDLQACSRHLVAYSLLDAKPGFVRGRERCVRIAVDVHGREQLPPHPSSAHVVNAQNAVDLGRRRRDLVEHGRVDRVHHPVIELLRRPARMKTIAAEIPSPTRWSAIVSPRPAKPMPAKAPADTRASMREWTPSASRASKPIPRPTLTLYSDTARLAMTRPRQPRP